MKFTHDNSGCRGQCRGLARSLGLWELVLAELALYGLAVGEEPLLRMLVRLSRLGR
jgi:hypothetical protein